MVYRLSGYLQRFNRSSDNLCCCEQEPCKADREDERRAAAGLAGAAPLEEMADSGRFPRRDEINSRMRGEDGANCLLIVVEWSIELSHFVVSE
jgi:hypothetical protein